MKDDKKAARKAVAEALDEIKARIGILVDGDDPAGKNLCEQRVKFLREYLVEE